jgi:prevent-host-death family protein
VQVGERLEVGLSDLHRRTREVVAVVRAERVPVHVIDARSGRPVAVLVPADEEETG